PCHAVDKRDHEGEAVAGCDPYDAGTEQVQRHEPGGYDGRVVLFRATEPAPHTVHDPAYERDDEALGWDEVCPRLTVVPVEGHHLSLLDPPQVDGIATRLRREAAEQTR
ncbi:hypothetical protein ABZ372_48250, partial [Streptomyces sp. NPDC005921]